MMFFKAIFSLACAVGLASAENLRAVGGDGGKNALPVEAGENHRALTYQDGDYPYKYIEVYDKDDNKYKCWEAKKNGDYYYIYANDCNHNDKKQDWYYTKYGEIRNREYYDYCVHYDTRSSNSDSNLILKYCDGGYDQKWNYIYYHFVSHYDGYCADLWRDGGGKFGVKKCDKDNKDQEHKVEDYWFYEW